MNRVCLLVFVFSTLLLSSAYDGEADSPPPVATPAADHKIAGRDAKVMACSLVTPEEVGAIQGAAMTDPNSSEAPQGEFVMTQCYWGSKEPNKSVSLGVFQRDPARPGNGMVAEFWHETFDKFTDTKNSAEKEKLDKRDRANPTASKGSKSEEQEERSKMHPQRIEGLGEEAFWLANPVGGMLYVLKDDLMLRISIGGPGDQNSKLEKSKALALKVMARLPK